MTVFLITPHSRPRPAVAGAPARRTLGPPPGCRAHRRRRERSHPHLPPLPPHRTTRLHPGRRRRTPPTRRALRAALSVIRALRAALLETLRELQPLRGAHTVRRNHHSAARCRGCGSATSARIPWRPSAHAQLPYSEGAQRRRPSPLSVSGSSILHRPPIPTLFFLRTPADPKPRFARTARIPRSTSIRI